VYVAATLAHLVGWLNAHFLGSPWRKSACAAAAKNAARITQMTMVVFMCPRFSNVGRFLETRYLRGRISSETTVDGLRLLRGESAVFPGTRFDSKGEGLVIRGRPPLSVAWPFGIQQDADRQ
jgi:hypothetical protein